MEVELNMKQTKKFTRSQHEYLQKRGVNTLNCRLIEETKDYIKFLNAKNEVEVFWKGSAR